MNIEPAELRRVLEDVLRTDEDLVAFCLDAKLGVANQFSSEMSRTKKLNLLLQKEDAQDVLKCCGSSSRQRQTTHFKEQNVCKAMRRKSVQETRIPLSRPPCPGGLPRNHVC
jgi:hypothetical protein